MSDNAPPDSPRQGFDQNFERGMRNRRAALGDAWVDASIPRANSFNAEFQHFITEYAWHGVWGRPGLDWRARRLMVLAITSALGRWDEFEIHLRGALTPGNAHTLSVDEVREALIHISIYAGVPAANTGFARALSVMRELGMAPEPRPAQGCWHPGVGRSVFTRSRPRLHATIREARNAPEGTPSHTIVLSHALGMDAGMWDEVANAMAATCRVICPDARGHGRSHMPAQACTMSDLAADAARLIDEFNDGAPVVWVGLSMGGLIGQELALRHPDKVKALVLANTTAGHDEAARAALRERMAVVQAQGMRAISTATMARFFTSAYRARRPADVARHQRLLEATDPEGYVGCAAALCEADFLGQLHRLRLPTLVVGAGQDPGLPKASVAQLAHQIAGADFICLDDCAHLSAAEQPAAFAELLGEFVASL